MRQSQCDSTWSRRAFGCLSKVIKVIASRSQADLCLSASVSALDIMALYKYCIIIIIIIIIYDAV